MVLLVLTACAPDVSVSKYKQAPEVAITFPADGASVTEGAALTFRADVVDADSPWDSLTYTWSTGTGGLLAGTNVADESGASFLADALPNGEHEVTVTVLDGDGLEARDTVAFAVVAGEPPVVSFVTPASDDRYATGQDIDVDVLVSDDDAPDLNTIALTWDGDGIDDAPTTADSDGHARFRLTPLDVGAYSLSVTATDTEGATNRATVYFDVVPADADGDGHDDTAFGGDDCDDTDGTVHPDAPETCDGRDEDCDGTIDEDATDAPTWYDDADTDGYGDPATALTTCDAPSGMVADDDDCDDTEATIHPGAEEQCDGVDDDCDGSVDEAAVDMGTWYADADGDTYGDPDNTTAACTVPSGHVADDADCDDTDAAIHPGVEDVCDGVDNDCDGSFDEDAEGVGVTWYRDADGDGYGDAVTSMVACDSPEGYVENPDDCDDGEDDHHPGADERCDGDDDDCDGDVDESAVDATAFYADSDGDGFGDPATTTSACTAEAGWTEDDTDCDDTDDGINPDATEVCSGVDEDCDGLVDDADPDTTGRSTWYEDSDGDGYGSTVTTSACLTPEDYSARGGDCDDTDDSVSPAGTEDCATAADDDCDGDDNEVDARGCTDWYVDGDGDDWGGAGSACLCDAEGAYLVTVDGDCDDADADSRPDGAEVCGDDVDQDCDGADTICPIEGDLDLDDADLRYTGTATSMYTGDLVGFTPDVDGDGNEDVWIASPTYKINRGIFWMLPGVIAGETPVSEAYTTISGTSSSQGLSTVAFSDFDGDGTPDLAIGAWGWDSGAADAGSVWIYPGPVSGGAWSPDAFAETTFEASTGDDHLGHGLAAGDFDGDGFGDLAMGAPGDDRSRTDGGSVSVVFGPLPSGTVSASSADVVIEASGSSDAFGLGMTTVDLDGDGVPEVAADAYCEDSGGSCSGTVYVYALDGTSAVLSADDYDWAFIGDAAGQWYGYGYSSGLPLLRGLPDVTGDGLADLTVGSEADDSVGTDAGSVIVVPGSATRAHGTSWTLDRVGAELKGASAGDHLASADAGDVDGDGTADLLAGGGGVDTGGSAAGAAYLFYGPISLTTYAPSDADATLVGPNANDGAGASVAANGDVNGDGYADLLVGGAGEDSGGSNAGVAWLFWGTAR